MNTTSGRVADYPIEPLFLERWSPRAFSPETIPEAELLTILEGARWAPSASNAQPWRFVYARRGTSFWTLFIDLLVPGNKVWAENAAALVFHSFQDHDASARWRGRGSIAYALFRCGHCFGPSRPASPSLGLGHARHGRIVS